MPASIGVNLRVTGHCSQGGRKYMEDLFSVAYQQTEDERDLEYAFFGIYDGHGGSEAAAFAKEHLMDSIVKQRQFWSDNDEDVLRAIRNGYMLTHLNMWKELEKWPKTVAGLPSTAGTTASVAFIRRGKIYIGHVGDSAIVLGYERSGRAEWAACALTHDHKPEARAELERIERCGGKVVAKAGVPRVVWARPRLQGAAGGEPQPPAVDEIPFLAVARSLGDLWSYNAQRDEFVVSPEPDVGVLPIDPTRFRCLIFGTDGLWNMVSAEAAVRLVQATERHNEAALVGGADPPPSRNWLNPSKSLVDHALERWSNTRMRADNTSVVTLMLDPPGPPRATVLRARSAQRPARAASPALPPAPTAPDQGPASVPAAAADPPQNGLAIMTRYSDAERTPPAPPPPSVPLPPCASLDGRFSVGGQEERSGEAALPPLALCDHDRGPAFTNYGNPAESSFMTRLTNRSRLVNTLDHVHEEIANAPDAADLTDVPLGPSPAPSPVSAPAPEASPAPAPTAAASASDESSGDAPRPDDARIQINEVSSSSPTEAPPLRVRARRPHHPAPSGRVLRSHDADRPAPRPQTRRVAARAVALDPAPSAPPVLERVVILNRARGVPVPPAVLRVAAPPDGRSASRRVPDEPVSAPALSVDSGRVTRSKESTSLPFAQKITRSIGNVARELRGHSQSAPRPPIARPGNSLRAPGPPRRTVSGPRDSHPRTDRAKENFGTTKRRRGGGRSRAPPGLPELRDPAPSALESGPRPPRPARRPPPCLADEVDTEVHSTTDDPTPLAPCGGEVEPAAVTRPRALRSRNDAGPPLTASAMRREISKRPPPLPATIAPAAKAAKLSAPAAAERCTRALAKRASGPWAPALALRNRLRKRLVK